MKELLMELRSIGLVKPYSLSEQNPPSKELIREMWKHVSSADPNPRKSIFVVYLEKNFPEYLTYADYIWDQFPAKSKIWL